MIWFSMVWFLGALISLIMIIRWHRTTTDVTLGDFISVSLLALLTGPFVPIAAIIGIFLDRSSEHPLDTVIFTRHKKASEHDHEQ